ncbi:MAG TPA: M12 family metallopeptidase [Vicinamibacterales bacterium]|nr:M12 family metallopeptidase [Vicinamibacterales bacterium]
MGGATLTPGWSLGAVVADADGNFMLGDVANPPSSPYPVAVSANGMITRDTWFSWSRSARTGVDITLIRDSAPFSMEFYRQFVRDTYDNSEGSPWPVLRWTSAPSFYVRTVDAGGRAVEPEVLAVTLDAIRRAVPAYTGGTYTATVETGTDARPERTGWIAVNFMRNTGGRTCGTSYVGRNPGEITLYIDVCSCGSVKVPGAVTMHEVGHAMGFFHVSDRGSLMYPFASGACPAGVLSAAESYHAGIAYSRPRGNRDPDRDPNGSASFSGAMIGGGPLVK